MIIGNCSTFQAEAARSEADEGKDVFRGVGVKLLVDVLFF